MSKIEINGNFESHKDSGLQDTTGTDSHLIKDTDNYFDKIINTQNNENHKEIVAPKEKNENSPECTSSYNENIVETDSNLIQETGKYVQKVVYSKLKDDGVVSYWDIISTIISIILRLVSVILNILVAYEYYNSGKINYFAWTSCCIFIPMIITSFISIYMYALDRRISNRRKHSLVEIFWFVIIFPFFFRYCQSLSHAVASKKAENRNDETNQKKFFKYMIQEESDVSLIRIFECFLEAAPQKVLQISIILAGENEMTWMQLSAIGGCFVSLSWCMVVYHKYNRYIQPDKEKLSLCGVIMQYFWHFFITVSRVLCIAIVASLFPIWTLVGCCVHALLMCLAIFFFDRPDFCSNTFFHSFSFTLILGIVYIFTYIIPKEGRTRYRFTLYYFVCIIENIICITLFIIYATDSMREDISFIPLCVFSTVLYFLGIVFMIFYYTTFHPNIMARAAHASKTSLDN